MKRICVVLILECSLHDHEHHVHELDPLPQLVHSSRSRRKLRRKNARLLLSTFVILAQLFSLNLEVVDAVRVLRRRIRMDEDPRKPAEKTQ